MRNLMRYNDGLRRFPGAPDFDGSPRQSNEHYEDAVMPTLLLAVFLAAGWIRAARS